MRAKFRNATEFESILKQTSFSLFYYSGSPKYGATWKQYKSGDPSEDRKGDLSVVLRSQTLTERIDNRVTQYDYETHIYKRLLSFAKFKVNAFDESLFLIERHMTLFEMIVEWDYIGGIDPT